MYFIFMDKISLVVQNYNHVIIVVIRVEKLEKNVGICTWPHYIHLTIHFRNNHCTKFPYVHAGLNAVVWGGTIFDKYTLQARGC